MRFKKLRHRAFKGDRTYSYLTEKYDLKESSIQSAASKTGLTNKVTYLKHIFWAEEEEAFGEV